MGSVRMLLFTVALFGLQAAAHGAKHGGGSCKNCKNKIAHNSQRLIASPINLLNPDRYEFFTLDDKGKVVKRIMTFKEIQSIVAGSDITELKLFANKSNNDRIVSSVVSNVRNVLNNELNLMNGHDHIEPAEFPISDVIGAPQEPSATATMYDVLNKLGESLVTATSKRTTIRPTTTTTEQTSATPEEAITMMPIKSTVASTTRLALKTTQKPTVRTTTTTTVRPTTSSTERTTVRFQPTETTHKLRSSTTRPTERSTTEQPAVRSTISHTASKTTQQPMTTTIAVQTTRHQSTVSSTTARPTETTATVQSTVRHSTAGRPTTTTTTEAPLLKWAETSLAAVRRTTEAPTSKPSPPTSTTTTGPPTELAMFKEAQPTATATVVRTTEAPTHRTSEMSLPTTKTTATAFTKPPTKAPTERPQLVEVTVKPAEQFSVVEHSSQRSEEVVSESDNFVEYSTEQSSEKWNDNGSSEPYTTSEEASAERTTEHVVTNKLDEGEPAATIKTVVEMITLHEPDAISTLELSTPEDEDAPTAADESGSTEELYKTTGGLSTWFMNPVTQVAATAQQTQQDAGIEMSHESDEAALDGGEQPATESMLDEETPIASTTSLEIDSSTVQHDSTGYSDERQQFDETPLTTLNMHSEESTTTANGEPFIMQTDPEQTVPQDTSTIPSDAQHAIHKIIESLQSINDNSASEESDEADSLETNYPGDVPGMNYDAQSSINAIIQSLGQGALGGGGDSSLFSITTDPIATDPEEEPTTVMQPARQNTPSAVVIATETPSTTSSLPTTTVQQTTTSTTTTTSLPVLKTSKPPVVVPEDPPSTSNFNFNYNTNIMETIEKFLSSFGNLPKDSTYSANLTDLNILSDYPAELNMTDYVDRTATVASVLKFPQPGSPEEGAEITGEVESLEEATTEPELLLAEQQQPILTDPVASFMKLGEMLTMGTKIGSTELPVPVQLEVKTAVDEEETELLRFLTICSNLGTTVYDYLTDAPNGARSPMSGRSLVYSPFATITTLSMLFLGTRGTTAESINGVIGLDEMTSFNPHLFFKSIAADLTPKYRRTFAREGNGLAGESTFSRTLLSDESRGGLQRFFKARIQEIYATVAETVDFRQKDMLLRHMNGDFPREYVDTLKQLRSPLVSISRNRYRHDCNGAATTFGTLQFGQRTSGTPSVVPSVTFRSGFSTGYSTVLDATILALPGSTSNVSVYFIKPATATDVSELETHLRNQNISNVLKLFPDETVRTAYAEVQLPYFTQTTIYNMTESIRQLGLQNLFEPNVANFNGLQDSSTSNLHLSELIQTDSFALCGAASESATRTIPLRSFSTNLIKHSVEPTGDRLTDRTMGRLMRRNGRKLVLRNRSAFDSVPNMQDSTSSSSKLVFDTPFLYLVRHNPTGMFLYMGRFVGNA